MRVLITSPVFPPDLGGPAVYVPSIGRFLADRGHDVRVVAFCSDPEPTGYPFPVHAISRGPLPIRYLRAFWEVFKRAGDVDVVYVQEHLALLHVLAAKLRFRPVVIRIMVDGAWEISHRKGWCNGENIVAFQKRSYGFRVWLARFLQRRWWGMCTRIICCSNFLRGILLNHHDVHPQKALTILNAYHGPRAHDVGETKAEAVSELGLDPSKRYLLTICRLMVWKRVDGIIEALVHLPEDVELLVAGDGDQEEPLRTLASELGVADRVRFLGNVPHARIPLHIRAADVFVLNSEYEGLSHTLLEVQAIGTPIVCSGVCGNPEVVEDGVNGLLVDPDNLDQMVNAVEKVLADPALAAQFVAAGHEREGLFDRDATFTAVEAVLADAAKPSHS